MARIAPGPDTGPQSFLFRWRRAIAESELSSSARLVAWTLSLHMDLAGGSCWPATPTLARESGLSDRKVHGVVKELEKAGFLRIAWSKGGRLKSGVYRTNSYQASLPDQRGRGLKAQQEEVSRQELRRSSPQVVRGSIPAVGADNPAAAADEEVQEEVTSKSSARVRARDDRESEEPAELVHQRYAELSQILTEIQAGIVANLARRQPAFRREHLSAAALMSLRLQLQTEHGSVRGDGILTESLQRVKDRDRGEPIRSALGLLDFVRAEVAREFAERSNAS